MKGILVNTDKNILDGIRKVVTNTRLSGRWQIIGRKPLVVCDTGHNKEGLEYVLSQLGRIKKDKLHIVLGFVSDKDRNSVLLFFRRRQPIISQGLLFPGHLMRIY